MRLLVVEDEVRIARFVKKGLEAEGYEVDVAADGQQGLRLGRAGGYDLVILDLILPLASGIEVCQQLRAAGSSTPILMLTAKDSVEDRVTGLKSGADDYLSKPFAFDELLARIQALVRRRDLALTSAYGSIRSAVESLAAGGDAVLRPGPTEELLLILRDLLARREERPPDRPGASTRKFHDLVFQGPRMAEVADLIATVAASDATVLIQGETGTGKELVARAIHAASRRRSFPLVAVACAAIPETLLEDELFGHEKGAFTGAIRDRKGRFELAAGGSLFLDEIADLGLGVQAKLLRVLQERAFERLGGTRPVKVDVRVMSGTLRRLEEEVQRGRFREDLFYRLKVITITLPPLRERKEDILPLAEHFLQQYTRPLGKAVEGLSPEAHRELLQHEWRGNVRELEAAIQRAVVLARGPRLTPDDLGLGGPAGASPARADASRPLLVTLRETERQYLDAVLRSVGGHRRRAAEILGISRKTLWKKLRHVGLE